MESKLFKLEERANNDVYLIPKYKHTHTLIFMHGFGDSPGGYYDFFLVPNPPVPKGMKVVLLCAPLRKVPYMFGEYLNSWFDFDNTGFKSEEDYSISQVNESADRIKKIIEEEVKVFNGDYSKIFVGGFSQGACLALYVGFTFEKILGGVVVLSGVLFPAAIRKDNAIKEKESLPIFIGHGDIDMMIRYENSVKSYEPIKNKKNAFFHVYRGMIHSICEQEEKDMLEFLTKYTKGNSDNP